ncbi:hypothetical protein [Streptomyces sp. NPDC101455]|uniref:hypothetical protein n=1 Tax=Streptomyces sp. NPDC101455 TaxID=3366142 RepID=UPI003801A160
MQPLPHDQQGKPQRNPNARATREEIEIALKKALMEDAKTIRTWGDEAKQRPGLLSAGLTPAHVPMWTRLVSAFIESLIGEVKQQIQPLVARSVQEGLERLQVLRIFKVGEPAEEIQYLRDNVTYETVLVATVNEGKASGEKKLAEYVSLVVELDGLLTRALAELLPQVTFLTKTCTWATTKFQKVDVSGLQDFLRPIAEPVRLCCASAAPLLALTEDSVLKQVEIGLTALIRGTADHNKAVITTCVRQPMHDCGVQQEKVFNAAKCLTDDLLTTFSCVLTLPPKQREACATYAGKYGRPWVMCLASLDKQPFETVLQRCAMPPVQQALAKQVPLDTPNTAMELTKAIAILGNPAVDWEVACGKLNTMNFTQITLPGGVKPLGWSGIGTALVPSAFAMGSYETNPSCLKHMEKELGANPGPEKACSYFADLVTACTQAVLLWGQAGRPEAHEAKITVNGAIWTIIVRESFASAQVFHVDSGYQNSPWVKKS